MLMNKDDVKMNPLINRKLHLFLVVISWFFWQTTVNAQPALSKTIIYQAWPKPSSQQVFKEVRYDALLDIKTRYQGVFKLASPDGLTIQYQQPIQGSLSFDDQFLTMNFPNQKMQVGLNQLPELAQFLTPIKALLYGDPKVVESEYNVAFKALSDQAWQLSYWPKKNRPLVAKHLVVTGHFRLQKNQLKTIRIELESGDWREFELVYD